MPVSGVRRLLLLLPLSWIASAAGAQSNVVAPPPPPRTDTVGPEQLRNFALPGTQQPAQQAETPPATSTTPTRPAPTTTTTLPPPVRERAPAPAAEPRDEGPATRQERGSRPADSVSVPLPSATAPSIGESTALGPVTLPPPTTVGGGSSGSVLPAPVIPAPVSSEPADDGWPGWLLPLLAAVAAAGILAWWWMRRDRRGEAEQDFGELAFAGAPATLAPRPAPAPRPEPVAPEPPARAPSVGLVSSRLRAWLDLDLGLRVAAMTEEELVLEVDILLTNSGSAAAREIAVEALLINAGPEQGVEIGTFYARPDATDFARDGVAPMNQMALSATLKMPRGAFREYAVGGGKVVVPIVALNASYKAGSSRGRTSAAFLVGRAGADAEKLGPFPTDQGAKGFNRLGLKRLPEQVRR